MVRSLGQIEVGFGSGTSKGSRLCPLRFGRPVQGWSSLVLGGFGSGCRRIGTGRMSTELVGFGVGLGSIGTEGILEGFECNERRVLVVI